MPIPFELHPDLPEEAVSLDEFKTFRLSDSSHHQLNAF
jgi:hypothetical protein